MILILGFGVNMQKNSVWIHGQGIAFKKHFGDK